MTAGSGSGSGPMAAAAHVAILTTARWNFTLSICAWVNTEIGYWGALCTPGLVQLRLRKEQATKHTARAKLNLSLPPLPPWSMSHMLQGGRRHVPAQQGQPRRRVVLRLGLNSAWPVALGRPAPAPAPCAAVSCFLSPHVTLRGHSDEAALMRPSIRGADSLWLAPALVLSHGHAAQFHVQLPSHAANGIAALKPRLHQ